MDNTHIVNEKTNNDCVRGACAVVFRNPVKCQRAPPLLSVYSKKVNHKLTKRRRRSGEPLKKISGKLTIFRKQ